MSNLGDRRGVAPEVHIDNPHSGDDAGLPDNGMRALVDEGAPYLDPGS